MKSKNIRDNIKEIKIIQTGVEKEEEMKKIFIGLFCIFVLCAACNVVKREAHCLIVGEITMQKDSSGNAEFLGEIKNDGDKKAQNVKITFTIKGSGGNVLDTAFTYVNSNDLDPGQTSSFDCLSQAPYSQVSSYEYEIRWDESATALF